METSEGQKTKTRTKQQDTNEVARASSVSALEGNLMWSRFYKAEHLWRRFRGAKQMNSASHFRQGPSTRLFMPCRHTLNTLDNPVLSLPLGPVDSHVTTAKLPLRCDSRRAHWVRGAAVLCLDCAHGTLMHAPQVAAVAMAHRLEELKRLCGVERISVEDAEDLDPCQ